MPQQNNPRVQILQFGLRGWAAIGVAILVIAGLALLALGVLVFLLPVLLFAPVLFYFSPRPKTYPVKDQSPRDTTIIDGEFRVVDADQREGSPKTLRHGREELNDK